VVSKGPALTPKELKSPDAALEEVSARFRARDVDLSNYTLVRKEFGYLQKGYRHIEDHLAPAYAFGWDPKEGVTSKRLVEVTWAVTGKHAAPVLHDDELDLDRKRQLSPEVHP
jgi:hypothetical protein